VKARKVKKLDPAAPLAENAARIARARLDELRSFAPAALEPAHERQQHDMRIAAKRLRYVLEATEFCFGKLAQTARRRARDLQDLLGELPRPYARALALARHGRLQRAAANLEELLREDPANERARADLAHLRAQSGRR
jgi:CHAD domain-containing protein